MRKLALAAAAAAVVLITSCAAAKPEPPQATPTTRVPTTTTTTAATTVPAGDVEVARSDAAMAERELQASADRSLRAELDRIEVAADDVAADARQRLVEFRGHIEDWWLIQFEMVWADLNLPGDSSSALRENLAPPIPLEVGLAAFNARSMLNEIDYAIDQVSTNTETARDNAKYAARRFISDKLLGVQTEHSKCMLLAERAGPTAEGINECSELLVLDGDQLRWPPYDWSCVHQAVLAVLALRPDTYDPMDPDAVGAEIGRIFACFDLELPE